VDNSQGDWLTDLADVDMADVDMATTRIA
jgi:hypothetical protein